MSDSSSESSAEESSSSEWPVTDEWLAGVLRQHHGDVTVAGFTVRPGCDAGASVLSDILAVNVEYRSAERKETEEGTDRANLVVKLLPQDPFSRFFVTEAQFDLREIKWYTQVVPELDRFQKDNLIPDAASIDLPVPRCYHAHYTEEPAESVLVLEDVRPAGYSAADFSRGLSFRQASAAVEAVARIHSLSFCLKVKKPDGPGLPERYSFLFQTARATDSYQQLVERGLPQLSAFLERRPGHERVLEALAAIRPNTRKIIADLLAPVEPMALITHTDFWCNNLMFREQEGREKTECIILDWQMVTYSRPTNDLALLLVSSVSGDLRRAHTEDLLDRYWNELLDCCRRLGVDVENDHGYSREDLSTDFNRSLLLALLLCVGSVDVALGDPLTEQRLLDVLHDLSAGGVLTVDASLV